MPPRSWRLRVEDILTAIGRIQSYTSDMTFESFCADDKTVDAVARNIEIVGEASRHIPTDVQNRYPALPWTDMRGLRNIAAHEYFQLDLSILWDTVQKDLPPLLPLLKEILEREP